MIRYEIRTQDIYGTPNPVRHYTEDQMTAAHEEIEALIELDTISYAHLVKIEETVIIDISDQ